jgi:hypothetical protein
MGSHYVIEALDDHRDMQSGREYSTHGEAMKRDLGYASPRGKEMPV